VEGVPVRGVELVLLHRVLDLDRRVDGREPALEGCVGVRDAASRAHGVAAPLDVHLGEVRAVVPVALVDGLVRPGTIASGAGREDPVFRGRSGVRFVETFFLLEVRLFRLDMLLM